MMEFVTSYLRLYRCTESIPLSSVEMLAKKYIIQKFIAPPILILAEIFYAQVI